MADSKSSLFKTTFRTELSFFSFEDPCNEQEIEMFKVHIFLKHKSGIGCKILLTFKSLPIEVIKEHKKGKKWDCSTNIKFIENRSVTLFIRT